MKLKILMVAAAVLTLTTIGSGVLTASAKNGDISPVFWFEDRAQPAGAVVPGASSTLLRDGNGVTVSLNTSGLMPDHAYTVWWVVFNKPSLCTSAQGGCSPDDVMAKLSTGQDPIGIGILYAGGHVTGANGRLSLGAHLREGDLSGCQTSAPFAGACTALADSKMAEVQLVIHDHGPPIPGKVASQIGSFEGGCDSYIYGPDGSELVHYGLGTYKCFSPQATVHKP